jgi:hypothetical protein
MEASPTKHPFQTDDGLTGTLFKAASGDAATY